MSKKSKTRFIVRVNGLDRELLNIRQQNGGAYPNSLRISLNHARFYTGSPFHGEEIQQQYYSVHESPTSKGNLIHQTIELKNGAAFESRHFSFGIANSRFAPVSCSIPADLRIDDYARDLSRPRDDVRCIGEFDATKGNIIWALVISGVGVELKVPPGFYMNYAFADFAIFRINLLWTFVGIAPTSAGNRVHFLTDLVTAKGVPRSDAAKLQVGMVEGVPAEGALLDCLSSAMALYQAEAHAKSAFERKFLEGITGPRPFAY